MVPTMNGFQCSNNSTTCYLNDCIAECGDSNLYYQQQQQELFAVHPPLHAIYQPISELLPMNSKDPHYTQHCDPVPQQAMHIAPIVANHDRVHHFTQLPFAMTAHPDAHFPNKHEIDIPIPEYAPCQGPRPWNYSYCYGFYGEPACPLVNLVDMEDFMWVTYEWAYRANTLTQILYDTLQTKSIQFDSNEIKKVDQMNWFW